MKLTKLQLKQVIQEEVVKFNEAYYHPAGATPGAKGEDPKLAAWQQSKPGWAPGGGDAAPEEEPEEEAADVDTNHITNPLEKVADELTRVAEETEESHPHASEIYEKMAHLLDSYSGILQTPTRDLERDEANLLAEIEAAANALVQKIERNLKRADKIISTGSGLVHPGGRGR